MLLLVPLGGTYPRFCAEQLASGSECGKECNVSVVVFDSGGGGGGVRTRGGGCDLSWYELSQYI